MAATSVIIKCYYLPANFCLFVLFLSGLLAETSARIPDNVGIEELGNQLDRELTQFVESTTGLNILNDGYTAAVSDKSVETLDGASLVQQVASHLGDIFSRKITALEASTQFAEELITKYTYNPKLKDVDYVFSKTVYNKNISYDNFQMDERYRRRVSRVNSSVHIPIDIYRGDVDILNALAWTSDLDQIWKANKEKDESLSWQYFGSQTGVLRSYPASEWSGGENDIDLYDVRRRPWYSQGASSPKEMLILIDTSGSCHGQALALMKHSINSIIDTLGENDFVNVANFSENATLVGCFKTFVQATPSNKKKLISFVDTLKAGGVANYDKGFTFAFQKFEEYNSNNTNRTDGCGARCNQVIMFLTDGGTEKPEEIFKTYNSQKKIRIFSYAVGPIANPIAAVRWIGCVNRGNFYQIPAMGAIRSKVQDYLSILATPQTYNTTSRHTWTSLYSDKLGLGLVTSATLPVFNRSLDVGNQTLLGVMGVDVPISELVYAMPLEKLGPNGYAFIINPNGNIVYHPKLDIMGEPLASPPSIDLVDIEEETEEKLQIRKDMIDQKTGHMSVKTFVNGLDDHHADLLTRHYYYTAIPNTNFSLAIVLTEPAQRYVEASVESFVDDDIVNHITASPSSLLIDFEKYCSDIEPVSNVSTELENFVETVLNNFTQCDEKKVNELMFDIRATKDIDEHWLRSSDKHFTFSVAGDRMAGVAATFVAGHPGFVRVYPSNESEYFVERLDTWNQVFFKRSLDNSENWMFSVLDIRDNVNDSGALIMATKAVSATVSSNIHYNMAVAGIQLTQPLLHKIVTEQVPLCTEATVDCYVVDDGAIVVFATDSSKLTKSVGKFLGAESVEPQLMSDLVNKSIFLRRTTVDQHATCYQSSDKQTSSAIRLLPSFLYELLTINWWTATSAWTYLNILNFYSWLVTASSVVQGDEMMAFGMDTEGSSCIQELNQYYFNPNAVTTMATGSVLCTVDCNPRAYAVTRLKHSNLMLVAIETNLCSVPCDRSLYSSLPFSPIEQTEEPLSSRTVCEVRQRYRRRPDCYQENPSESESHCAACSLSTSVRFITFSALSAVVFTTLFRTFL